MRKAQTYRGQRWRLLVKSLLIIVTFSACGSGDLFDRYQQIPYSGWDRDSVVSFRVNLTDTVHPWNLYLSVRNRGSYSYRNIWLFVAIQFPSGKVRTDTVEFTLADSSGKWRGRGIGDLFDNRFLYKENMLFPVSGTYLFQIRQGMRQKKLKGINDLGLRIEKRN